MNVLVLHSELGVLRGGGENFTRSLFTAFARRGHRVTAAFVADRRGRYRLPLPPAIEPIPINGWWARNLGQQLFFTIGQRAFRSGRAVVIRDRLQHAVNWRIVRWHNRRFQRRVERTLGPRLREFDSVYVHGDVELASRIARYRRTVLRLPGPVSSDATELLQQVHVVCANGDALARIRTFMAERITELPIGIDLSLFRPGSTEVRSELGWESSDVVIGYVGRLSHVKGVDLLAEAFATLCRAVSNLRLLMIGRGEADKSIRSTLHEQLARGIVHIQSDVAHEELPRWYRAMDVVAVPSRYENYSNALLEAMACGIPFVASDIGGNSTLAQSGSAWLCARDSQESLTRTLHNALLNRHELKARGQRALDYARAHYSWEKSAEVLESCLLDGAGAPR